MLRLLPLLLLAAACRDSGPPATTESRPLVPPKLAVPESAWLPSCLVALDRAAAAPPFERAPILLDGCRPCGVSWDPVLASGRAGQPGAKLPSSTEVLAVLDACGGACLATARSQLGGDISSLNDTAATKPWRTLAKACPSTVGVDDKTERYASAAWYALHHIASGLGRATLTAADKARVQTARGALTIPLPAMSPVATSVLLPTAKRVAEATPAIAITVGETKATLGVLGHAAFSDGGLTANVDGDTAPGPPVSGDLAEAVAALEQRRGTATTPSEVLLLAPRGVPASRILATVAALPHRRSYLGVVADSQAAGFVDVPRAHRVALAATGGGRIMAFHVEAGPQVRMALLDDKKGLSPVCVMADEAKARLKEIDTAMIEAGADATAQDLARVLDEVADGGVATAAPAPRGWKWPRSCASKAPP